MRHKLALGLCIFLLLIPVALAQEHTFGSLFIDGLKNTNSFLQNSKDTGVMKAVDFIIFLILFGMLYRTGLNAVFPNKEQAKERKVLALLFAVVTALLFVLAGYSILFFLPYMHYGLLILVFFVFAFILQALGVQHRGIRFILALILTLLVAWLLFGGWNSLSKEMSGTDIFDGDLRTPIPSYDRYIVNDPGFVQYIPKTKPDCGSCGADCTFSACQDISKDCKFQKAEKQSEDVKAGNEIGTCTVPTVLCDSDCGWFGVGCDQASCTRGERNLYCSYDAENGKCNPKGKEETPVEQKQTHQKVQKQTQTSNDFDVVKSQIEDAFTDLKDKEDAQSKAARAQLGRWLAKANTAGADKEQLLKEARALLNNQNVGSTIRNTIGEEGVQHVKGAADNTVKEPGQARNDVDKGIIGTYVTPFLDLLKPKVPDATPPYDPRNSEYPTTTKTVTEVGKLPVIQQALQREQKALERFEAEEITQEQHAKIYDETLAIILTELRKKSPEIPNTPEQKLSQLLLAQNQVDGARNSLVNGDENHLFQNALFEHGREMIKRIKVEPSDYQTIEGNTPDKLLLKRLSENPDQALELMQTESHKRKLMKELYGESYNSELGGSNAGTSREILEQSWDLGFKTSGDLARDVILLQKHKQTYKEQADAAKARKSVLDAQYAAYKEDTDSLSQQEARDLFNAKVQAEYDALVYEKYEQLAQNNQAGVLEQLQREGFSSTTNYNAEERFLVDQLQNLQQGQSVDAAFSGRAQARLQNIQADTVSSQAYFEQGESPVASSEELENLQTELQTKLDSVNAALAIEDNPNRETLEVMQSELTTQLQRVTDQQQVYAPTREVADAFERTEVIEQLEVELDRLEQIENRNETQQARYEQVTQEWSTLQDEQQEFFDKHREQSAHETVWNNQGWIYGIIAVLILLKWKGKRQGGLGAWWNKYRRGQQKSPLERFKDARREKEKMLNQIVKIHPKLRGLCGDHAKLAQAVQEIAKVDRAHLFMEEGQQIFDKDVKEIKEISELLNYTTRLFLRLYKIECEVRSIVQPSSDNPNLELINQNLRMIIAHHDPSHPLDYQGQGIIALVQTYFHMHVQNGADQRLLNNVQFEEEDRDHIYKTIIQKYETYIAQEQHLEQSLLNEEELIFAIDLKLKEQIYQMREYERYQQGEQIRLETPSAKERALYTKVKMLELFAKDKPHLKHQINLIHPSKKDRFRNKSQPPKITQPQGILGIASTGMTVLDLEIHHLSVQGEELFYKNKKGEQKAKVWISKQDNLEVGIRVDHRNELQLWAKATGPIQRGTIKVHVGPVTIKVPYEPIPLKNPIGIHDEQNNLYLTISSDSGWSAWKLDGAIQTDIEQNDKREYFIYQGNNPVTLFKDLSTIQSTYIGSYSITCPATGEPEQDMLSDLQEQVQQLLVQQVDSGSDGEPEFTLDDDVIDSGEPEGDSDDSAEPAEAGTGGDDVDSAPAQPEQNTGGEPEPTAGQTDRSGTREQAALDMKRASRQDVVRIIKDGMDDL